MDDLKELMQEFEGLSDDETSNIGDLVIRINVKSDYDGDTRQLIDDINDIRNVHSSIRNIFRHLFEAENPDYTKSLKHLRELEDRREDTEDDIIPRIENLMNYIDSEENRQLLKKSIREEKKSREIENAIEDKLIQRVVEKAHTQAKNHMIHERPHVIFTEKALQNFIEFAYSETYETNKEASGAFKFERIEGRQGRKFDYRITEFIPAEEYRIREKAQVSPSEEFKDRVKNNSNLIYAHNHPPGAQKSHSGADKNIITCGEFAILGVPESSKKIWTVAQSWDKNMRSWKNHIIEVENGKVPQAHLNKYNKAIIRAKAFSELHFRFQEEYSSQENRYQKLFEDNKLLGALNTGGEQQWIKYLDTETY